MKIEIKRVTDWQRVVDAARFTQGKEPLGHEPSDEFKKQMILSEHSPLRDLEFDIKMYGIPYWVSNHFVRHVHAQPFVSTSRPDITGSKVSYRGFCPEPKSCGRTKSNIFSVIRKYYKNLETY